MKSTRLLLFGALVLVSGGCDHATKQLALDALQGRAPLSFWGDLVRFELAFNPGAFMSMGAWMPEAARVWLFQRLAPLAMIAAVVFAWRAGFTSRQALLGLALIVGGGGANWLDRVMNDGTVTDFVSLGVGPLRTGIFNVADLWVVLGVSLLLLARGPESEPVATEAPRE